MDSFFLEQVSSLSLVICDCCMLLIFDMMNLKVWSKFITKN
jgi:hypothetical protein